MIAALLEVTPLPPATDNIDELLAAAAEMVRARERVIATARTGDLDPSLAIELEARQVAWQVALAGARTRLGTQRVGARRVRAYASYR
jgi:precorrin-6B methylase 2